MIICCKFYPSSHSDDGAIVATFKDENIAKNVAKRFTCYGGTRLGSKVKVSLSNAEYGTLQNIANSMRDAGAKEVLIHEGYQELIIEVTLPRGITKETVALVCDTNTAIIIQKLEKLCGKPEEVLTRRSKKLVFKYAGEADIFSRASKRGWPRQNEFWLDEKTFYPSKAFKVRGLV